MDTNKHLTLETMPINGQAVSIAVTATRDGNSWHATAMAIFGISHDLENWASEQSSVQSYDKTPEAAIATTMLSVSNYVNNPDLLKGLTEKLLEFENKKLAEPNEPVVIGE